jgi:hypothetical protein
LPLNTEKKIKIYKSRYKNYSIVQSLFKPLLLNNSISYTITDATPTVVIQKILNSITKVNSTISKETI